MVFVPVIESRPREDHGVVIGPLRGVAPAGSGTIPVVAPCWITNDTLWKALPHNKGKIHLWEKKVKKEARGDKRRQMENKQDDIIGGNTDKCVKKKKKKSKMKEERKIKREEGER